MCAWDCENVVVIMTSETLKRMWCAAEIASAHAGQGNVVPWDVIDFMGFIVIEVDFRVIGYEFMANTMVI